MLAPRIYREEWEVDRRLLPFGVTQAELLEIVRGVVAARADAVEDDPLTAEGNSPISMALVTRVPCSDRKATCGTAKKTSKPFVTPTVR